MSDIHDKVSQLNALLAEVQAYKNEHPETKLGFYTSSVGSVLNAYREGDVSFDDAVKYIKAACFGKGEIEFVRWAEMYLTAQALELKRIASDCSETVGSLEKDRDILRQRREQLESEKPGE
jgi:hypothetical protein